MSDLLAWLLRQIYAVFGAPSLAADLVAKRAPQHCVGYDELEERARHRVPALAAEYGDLTERSFRTLFAGRPLTNG